jgi:hypothetical protein
MRNAGQIFAFGASRLALGRKKLGVARKPPPAIGFLTKQCQGEATVRVASPDAA